MNERTHHTGLIKQEFVSKGIQLSSPFSAYVDEHIKPSTEKKFGATAAQIIFRSFLLGSL